MSMFTLPVFLRESALGLMVGPIGGDTGLSALDAMFFAMIALKNRSASLKDARRAQFAHYVFGQNGDSEAHIPSGSRGYLGESDHEHVKKTKTWLIKQLS